MDRKDGGVKLNLRLDERLHQQLMAEARRSVRLLNGEIIWRLRKQVEPRPGDETPTHINRR